MIRLSHDLYISSSLIALDTTTCVVNHPRFDFVTLTIV